jgi:predicted DNA-binding transcriptional regulator AlpA
MEKEITPDLILDGERYFTRENTAKRLKCSAQTMAGWYTRGKGPPSVKFGRHVLYGENDLRAWIASKKRG